MPKLTPVKTKVFVQFLKYIGCTEDKRVRNVKRKGDHRKFHKEGCVRPVIFQNKNKEVPTRHIESNLRTLGISRDEFFQIMAEMQGKALSVEKEVVKKPVTPPPAPTPCPETSTSKLVN